MPLAWWRRSTATFVRPVSRSVPMARFRAVADGPGCGAGLHAGGVLAVRRDQTRTSARGSRSRAGWQPVLSSELGSVIGADRFMAALLCGDADLGRLDWVVVDAVLTC